jgi:ketosteroid isomerase-like protein
VVEAWNRDDLGGHVRPYADSATYMQAAGPLVGRAAIREMLRRSFQQPDGLAGTLVFRDLDIRILGDSAAVALGAFVVEKVRGDRDIRGRFTLILHRAPSGWQIVHDHSS